MKSRELINAYLLRMGFSPAKSGFNFLLDLIDGLVNDKQIYPLKNIGYPIISEKCNKSCETIEKCIQNAISIVWLKCDTTYLYSEFGMTIDPNKGKPSNKQFISFVADRISHIVPSIM